MEFGVGLVEVVGDGAGAEEELGGDLAVGEALGGQAGDLEFLGGEGESGVPVGLVVGAGVPVAVSSVRARAAQGWAARRSKVSRAARRWGRASVRRRERRSHSP